MVISGETGCGKSTQIPQFILDDWLLRSSNNNNERKAIDHVEIICTQPRRISAIGVAERVSEERVEKVNGENSENTLTVALWETAFDKFFSHSISDWQHRRLSNSIGE